MNKRLEKLNDYEGFVEKFKAKKTTDDCYTPPAVYEAVLGWVKERYRIRENVPIVRPFWPGGDYEHFDYPEGCIVIDNPPFSILSKIVRFYQERKVRFFLFTPYLTLMQYASIPGVSLFPIDLTITYHNGAKVNTSFISNLEEPAKAIITHSLRERLKNEKSVKSCIFGYDYPPCVLTSTRLGYIAKHGGEMEIPLNRSVFIRKLKAEGGHTLFGGGILVGEDIARQIEQYEQGKRIYNNPVELTEDELAIVRSLTRHETE